MSDDVIVEEPTEIYQCDVCGQRFDSLRRKEYHINNMHTSTKFTVVNEPAEVKTPPKKESKAAPKVASVTKITNPEALRLERKQKWSQWIYKDANPVIFSGVKQFAAIPDGWEDQVIAEFVTPDGKTVKLWEPTLRQRLTFSESDSEKLADALARFSVSPMGLAITAWIEANAGLISLALAAWIAGRFGWRVMQTKAEIAQFKEMLKQQQEAMMAQNHKGDEAAA